MQSCYVLSPPNSHNLSADVIGSVVQRVWVPRRTVCTALATKEQPTNTGQSTPKIIDRSDLKRLRKVDIKAYRRELHRRNQERYRKKQRQTISNLDAVNQQLQAEIQRLEDYHNNLLYPVPTKDTIWSVASEYFRVFRHGLVSMSGNHMAELDSLRAAMTPDVNIGTDTGFDALTTYWKALTDSFQDLQLHVGRLDLIAENSLLATTTLVVPISRRSLQNLFPHLRTSLGDRLLGQCLVIRGSVRFDWDSSSNKVASVISQGDMVSPMLQVLGNLEDVNRTFSKALIQPDCNLVTSIVT